MGGKKKKSAAQAATPAAPAAAAAAGRTGAAAAGNGVAEEPKKQPASNKPAKPAKESKSKGGVTWLVLPGWCHTFRNVTVPFKQCDVAFTDEKLIIIMLWSFSGVILGSFISYRC